MASVECDASGGGSRGIMTLYRATSITIVPTCSFFMNAV